MGRDGKPSHGFCVRSGLRVPLALCDRLLWVLSGWQEALVESSVDCEFSGSTAVACFLHGR